MSTLRVMRYELGGSPWEALLAVIAPTMERPERLCCHIIVVPFIGIAAQSAREVRAHVGHVNRRERQLTQDEVEVCRRGRKEGRTHAPVSSPGTRLAVHGDN
jgi:hypothetical protein